ncbi:spermine oxidase-like isoform X1 [Maniola hyperantus]|uniref:spermine oxidase-like isoform X1 n=2 Tax=Aphantopus hyperantus TaxID=2795564 RepID=UPI001568DCF5|nr:spermine oxidase-like [Maniola hyperantus]
MVAPVMDIIVIGCGASGIAALRRLHDAGLKVLGLEAADRIGGRICTVEYGDCYLDLGAAWCHGEKDNVVFEMANPLNLLARTKPDHKYYLLSNGDSISTETGEKLLQTLDEEVGKADKNNSKSISDYVRNAAKTNPTFQKDPKLKQSFIEWYEKNNHLGGQSDPKMGKSLKGLEEWWVCEGDFFLNWKGKGYTTFLDLLLNKYPDASKELPIPIHLNKEVENIKWCTSKPDLQRGNPLVQIKCKDGSLYAAKSVIITVSIGVLKERYSQLFSPELPVEKINSINNLDCCILDKIYIEFTKPWWPKFPSKFNILWRDEDKAKFTRQERWITEIFGFNTVEYHPNLLLAWTSGEGAIEMEKVDEEQVKAGVKKLMQVLFRKEFQLNPVKSILRTQWASNPLVRGCYSYRSVKTEENGASAIILSEPLCHGNGFPVVCFAGEATSHHRHNAVHGAIEAGFREADRLIEKFKQTK